MHKVYVKGRRGRTGKVSYALRWICPDSRRWKSRSVGGDRKRAIRSAAMLEAELDTGTYRELRKTSWQAFTDRVTGWLKGRHAEGVKESLIEFGRQYDEPRPHKVTPQMVRDYVLKLESATRKPSPATINRKLRNLRLAYNLAIEDQTAKVNPVRRSHFRVVPKKDQDERRILEHGEEEKLLDAAEQLGGFHLRTFIVFALETWGRLGEITGLSWDDVQFGDEPCVQFRSTKSHEDRYIPLANTSLMADLLRLKAMTLADGGPFRRFADRSNLHKHWKRVCGQAEIPPITIHDLRRTGITRALLDGMTPVVVRQLAGHANIKTTMDYYVGVKRCDLRRAVQKRKVEAS